MPKQSFEVGRYNIQALDDSIYARVLHGMEPVLKLGCDLHEMIVIKLQIMLALIIGTDVHRTISHAEVEQPAAVEVSSYAEGLKDEGPLEASTDMDDGVVREQLHSD